MKIYRRDDESEKRAPPRDFIFSRGIYERKDNYNILNLNLSFALHIFMTKRWIFIY